MFLPLVRLAIYSIYLTLVYIRSSRSHVFCEGTVLENCTEFTEKQMCWSLLTQSPVNKFLLQTLTLLKTFQYFTQNRARVNSV